MSVKNSSLSSNDAWYRQFYVWLIIFLPACAVIASFATLYIAAQNPPELVVDDYSNIEAIVAENAAQDSAAAAMGLRAVLSFGAASASGTPVAIELQANKAEALPNRVILRVIHSTQAAQDAEAELDGGSGRYAGLIKLPQGRYDILLQDAARNWRLTTRVSGQPATLELLAPAAVDEQAKGN
jgi:hypothetical protein